jgi:hypothetical protein
MKDFSPLNISRDFRTFLKFENSRLHNASAFPTIGKKGLQVIEMIHNGSSAPKTSEFPFSVRLTPKI